MRDNRHLSHPRRSAPYLAEGGEGPKLLAADAKLTWEGEGERRTTEMEHLKTPEWRNMEVKMKSGLAHAQIYIFHYKRFEQCRTISVKVFLLFEF